MLRGQHLHCQRNNVDLFRNLTLNLRPGGWLQVTGPNGSGKSSLLRLLVGLLPSQAGKLFWNEREIRFPDPRFLAQVKYLGHKIGIQAQLTPRENLKAWVGIQKIALLAPTVPFIESALESWGLLEVMDTPCEQLSQGQCQRLALARLMLIPAKLWVLDEPCTALDRQGVQRLIETVEHHLEKQGMLVVVSHTPLAFRIPGQTLDLETESLC